MSDHMSVRRINWGHLCIGVRGINSEQEEGRERENREGTERREGVSEAQRHDKL